MEMMPKAGNSIPNCRKGEINLLIISAMCAKDKWQLPKPGMAETTCKPDGRKLYFYLLHSIRGTCSNISKGTTFSIVCFCCHTPSSSGVLCLFCLQRGFQEKFLVPGALNSWSKRTNGAQESSYCPRLLFLFRRSSSTGFL